MFLQVKSGNPRMLLLGAGVAAVLLGGLSACGRLSQSSASPSTAQDSHSVQLIPVTIAKAVNVIDMTAANIADTKGFFRQQGIAPTLVILQGGSTATSALLGGGVQFAMVAPLPFAVARTKGASLLAVQSIDHGLPGRLIVSNQWIRTHHLSLTQPLAQRIKGLEGITFAQVGPSDLAIFKMLLHNAGVNPQGVKVVFLGSGAAAATALTRGAVDAFQIPPPTSFEVQAQGYGTALVNYQVMPGFRHIENNLVITTTHYAQAHPRIVRKVVTAIGEGITFMAHHPQQTLTIEEKLWPKISANVLKQSLEAIRWNPKGLQSGSMWAKTDTFINRLGVIKNGKFRAVQGVDWTNRYIDQGGVGK